MESSEEQSRDRRTRQQQNRLPQYCRMQDVVLQPFPLTWLWKSGKAAEDGVPNDVNINNFRGTKRKADSSILTPVNTKEDVPRADSVIDITTPAPPVDHTIPATNTFIGSTPGPDTISASTPAIMKTARLSTPSRSSTKGTPLTEKQIEDCEFKDGKAAVPCEISDVCKRIRECKQHRTTHLPVRQELKKNLAAHFLSSTAYLRPSSTLYQWFGDTRLFSKDEWLWLIGKKAAYESRDPKVQRDCEVVVIED